MAFDDGIVDVMRVAIALEDHLTQVHLLQEDEAEDVAQGWADTAISGASS